MINESTKRGIYYLILMDFFENIVYSIVKRPWLHYFWDSSEIREKSIRISLFLPRVLFRSFFLPIRSFLFHWFFVLRHPECHNTKKSYSKCGTVTYGVATTPCLRERSWRICLFENFYYLFFRCGDALAKSENDKWEYKREHTILIPVDLFENIVYSIVEPPM